MSLDLSRIDLSRYADNDYVVIPVPGFGLLVRLMYCQHPDGCTNEPGHWHDLDPRDDPAEAHWLAGRRIDADGDVESYQVCLPHYEQLVREAAIPNPVWPTREWLGELFDKYQGDQTAALIPEVRLRVVEG